MLAHFDWAIYGFNSGHFWSTIQERGLPFRVVLACNPFVHGRALLHELLRCKIITNSAPALLDHIRDSGMTMKLMGYLIHSHCYSSLEPTSRFWEVQCNIVRQLQIIWLLLIIIAFVHPDHDCRAVSQSFVCRLSAEGWVITDIPIFFPNFGDSLAGHCWLIVAVHTNTETKCEAFALITPPSVPPWLVASFILAPFNTPEHAIFFSKDNPSFNLHAVNKNGAPHLQVSTPLPGQHVLVTTGVQLSYFLHCQRDNSNILPGTAVVKLDGLCLPFDPANNTNLISHYFGIKFIHNGHTNVHAIFPFEFTSCLCCPTSYDTSCPNLPTASVSIAQCPEERRVVFLTKYTSVAFIFA
jgi:hypothetical protein